jgi:hypothetical protein
MPMSFASKDRFDHNSQGRQEAGLRRFFGHESDS